MSIWVGSGLIVVINYGGTAAIDDDLHLITQSNIDITTQNNLNILVQEVP